MALNELDLTGNQMRDPSSLVEALCHQHTKLQKLHYEQNNLKPQAYSLLQAAFTFRENKRGWLGKLLHDIKDRSMVNFNLQNRKHGDEEIICLSRQLAKYHRKVSTAEFRGPNVTCRGIENLVSNVISTNAACLQRLYIREAPGVGDTGAAALAQALERQPNRRRRLSGIV